MDRSRARRWGGHADSSRCRPFRGCGSGGRCRSATGRQPCRQRHWALRDPVVSTKRRRPNSGARSGSPRESRTGDCPRRSPVARSRARASALPIRRLRTIGPAAPPGPIPAFRRAAPALSRTARIRPAAAGTDDDRSISSQTPSYQVNHGMVAQSFHFPAGLAIRVRHSSRWRQDEENQHADGASRGAGGRSPVPRGAALRLIHPVIQLVNAARRRRAVPAAARRAAAVRRSLPKEVL